MDINNYITSQYKALEEYVDLEFTDLYTNIENEKLKNIFVILHGNLINLFKTMNQRLPTNEQTAHFWAEPSRDLIKMINIATRLKRALKNSIYTFSIDKYYESVINKCSEFLSSSGGSSIPENMDMIDLYYEIPIFKMNTSIEIEAPNQISTESLKMIGEGSYANVYRYKDKFYNKSFIVKRAKKDLKYKELIRFKNEFTEMQKMRSPYIVDVYRYNNDNNEYIMECMDCTLYEYILKNNATLSTLQRKNICFQVLKAFRYIHSKGYLHRDISPKNVLIMKYDDVIVAKISDFGLVKIPELEMTSINSDIKGSFNDSSLHIDGFKNYNILHETYALTRLILFIMTGKVNLEHITNGKLYEFKINGLNPDKNKRFANVEEMNRFISDF
ncbi:protein kinase family protein [Lysinibacillus sphaericus]|uniref:protein kinase family protein n=1 Tax=Lysinibacillus sphaericus TaxID=1421 RepID=UPI001CBE77CB|nr:protein kinase family protein [Lysinibacillus sphaericus]